MRVVLGSLKVVLWLLAAVGGVALILAIMIATPLKLPAPLPFIADAVRPVDYEGQPPMLVFRARDGSYHA